MFAHKCVCVCVMTLCVFISVISLWFRDKRTNSQQEVTQHTQPETKLLRAPQKKKTLAGISCKNAV